MQQWLVRMLGPWQVLADGQPVEGWVSAKAQALVAYLACHEGPQSRQALMGLFWGEMPDSAARANLRKVLSNVRHIVGPLLQIERDHVMFLPEAATVDWRLVRACASQPGASVTELEAAAALANGEFLAGLTLRDAPAFEEWLVAQREHAQQTLIALFEALAHAQARRGDSAACQQAVARLLALDPYHEPAYRLLMRALAQSGQRSAALAAFEQCRRRLEEDLGLDPLPETLALYQRIAAAERAPTPQGLPTVTTPFIGRETELAQLAVAWDDPLVRLVTIVGPGGAGKTRLARQAISDAGARFWDGIWFVALDRLADLGPHDDAAPLLSALATTLGLAGDDPLSAIAAALRGKEALVVFDNAEHVAPLPSLVHALLDAAPEVQILVTSRERLNLQEEQLLLLDGLPLDDAIAPALFNAHARRVRADWEPDAAEQAAIRTICALLDGMPLAIELAAAWVRMLPCTEIAQALKADLDLLTTTMRNVPARHRSMRAAIDHSWRLLDSRDQALLSRLALFPAPFDLAAARAIAQASVADLVGLVDRSLLRALPGGRYALHTVVRQFVAVTLPPPPGLAAEHAAWYCQLLAQAADVLRGGEQIAMLQRLTLEVAHLSTALAHPSSATRPLFPKAVEGWFRFCEITSRFREGATLLGELRTTLAPSAPPALLALIDGCWAWLAVHLGDVGAARQALERSLPPLEDQSAALVFNLNYLAALARHQGEHSLTMALATRALHLAEAAEDHFSASIALNILGQTAFAERRILEARELCRRSLSLKRAIGDRWGMRFSLLYLGHIEQHLGQLEEAATLYGEVLALSRMFGDRRGEAQALRYLGDTAADQALWPEARSQYERAASIALASAALIDAADAMVRLGAACLELRERAAARRWFFQTLELALTLSHARALAAALRGIAAAADPPPTPLLDALATADPADDPARLADLAEQALRRLAPPGH